MSAEGPVQGQTGDSSLVPPVRRRPVARRRMAHALVVERVRSTVGEHACAAAQAAHP